VHCCVWHGKMFEYFIGQGHMGGGKLIFDSSGNTDFFDG
jgi:hypothetical protein